MERISINTAPAYEALVGRGLLREAGALAAEAVSGRHALIAADEHVAPLYLETARDSFDRAGFRTETWVFPAGEGAKTLSTVESMACEADARGLTRSDLFVALGGGVTGDLVGLAAALYLRGVDFVQIPTTLLAMADASVGGKTAANLPAGKNLVGAFHQPRLVICDPDTLQTLPPAVYAEGMAEIVKHGAICDAKLLDRIRQGEDLVKIVADNIRIKAEVVSRDEKERGPRQLLNLGHTFGHAIEKLSGFSIYHGEGVSVGICIAALAAERKGLCTPGVYQELREILSEAGLPVTTGYSAAQIAENAMNDKKRKGDTLTVVLPTGRGRSDLFPIPAAELGGLIACCDGEVTGR